MLYNALAAVGGCVTPAAALLLEFDGNTVVDARGPHARRARKDEAKQRKRAANGTKSSAPPPRAVCDCTHFCYSPEFWRGAFFPALRRALPSLPFDRQGRYARETSYVNALAEVMVKRPACVRLNTHITPNANKLKPGKKQACKAASERTRVHRPRRVRLHKAVRNEPHYCCVSAV